MPPRVLVSLIALLLAQIFAIDVSADDRPNILVILADDLGYSDLGCYGGEIRTPNVDRLAANGVRFTQFYTSARCCPTRASLMTGLYPSQAGIGDFTTNKPSKTRGPGYLGRLNENCVTLAEALKPAGYGCYYVGKWHLHPETGPIKRGFDEFYGYTSGYAQDQYSPNKYVRLPNGRKKEVNVPHDEFYATDVFNQYALEFIRQGQESDQPWFLFLGHSSPHFPVQAPADRVDKYFDLYMQGWDELRENRFARMKELGLIDGERWKLSPRSIVPVEPDDIANGYSGEMNPAWADLDTDRQKDLARRMAVFAAMVDSVDQGVGEIVEHLDSTGDLENTLILFLSDNGACYEWGPFGFDGQSRAGQTTLRTGDQLREIGQPGTHQSYGSAWANLGNTPFRMYKHFTHEGGISSPLIVHWPAGIGKPNRWARDPAHVMDILPSLVEVAGGSYPDVVNDRDITPCEGSSLLPVWRGKQLADRVIGFDHMAARALRQGDWKLVRSKRMPHEIKWELYNLAEDRCELNDLADQAPKRVEEMAETWERWARHVQVIWEGDQGKSAQSEPASPEIANRPFTATGKVELSGDRGVVAAQGGREYGYAIHVVRGKLAFDVRTSANKVTRIMSTDKAPKSFRFDAHLDQKRMTLRLDGEVVAETESPGLIPIQPKDGLSLGEDTLSAAGNYDAPNPLTGHVLSFEVKSDPQNKPANKLPQVSYGDVYAPLFADPHYNGSCDPEIVWNPVLEKWFVYYTARRATRTSASYVGTPIGVLSSTDLRNWEFLGYCSFDGTEGKPDNETTHWAPGIIAVGDELHMFATFKNSAKPPWGGDGVIRHYVTSASEPLRGWKLADVPSFQQPDPIDVSLIKVGDLFHAYYRVGKGGGIHWATSKDLSSWENHGACSGEINAKERGFGYQEAPYVFSFGDRFWMVTDPHDGLAVFHSPDSVHWTQQERILRDPGKREADHTLARHPSVAVVDDRAFIFYHTEPNRPYPSPPAEKRTVPQKISFLQIAELKLIDGTLTCDRNASISFPQSSTPD